MFFFSEIALLFFIYSFLAGAWKWLCGCYRRKGHQQRIFKRTGFVPIYMVAA